MPPGAPNAPAGRPMRPGPVQPGTPQSGPVRPGPVRPGTAQSGPVRPGPVRPGPVRPGTAPPGTAQPGTAGAAGRTGRPWLLRAAVAVRRHWLLSALLAAGLVLRVLAIVAYHPALLYVNTLKYLYGASPGSEPLGYTVLLRLMLLAGDLGTVAVIQHLLGLAMAVTLYAMLLRRGAARWLAALAVAPVLLDAYQIQMEQTIMPDVWFEAMIVAALAALLWRPAVSVPFAVAAGLILGSSATIKQLGELLVLPAVVYLLVAGGRRAITSSAALVVAFVLPILCYCSISYARTGHFWLAHKQPSIGRLAAAADCATLKLPAAARPLCPTPGEQAMGPDWLEHSGQSPLFQAAVPPGTRGRLIAALGAAVRHQQPVHVAAAIARDSLRLFSLTRGPTAGVTPISRWQFQTGYPTYPPWISICPSGRLGAQDCLAAAARHPEAGGPGQRPAGPARRHHRRRRADQGVRRLPRQRAPAVLWRQRPSGPAAGRVPACLPARRRLHPRPAAGPAGPDRLAGSVLSLIRRATGARGRQLALACLLFTATAAIVLLAAGRLRVLLAVPAARRDHPGAGRCARHQHPAEPPGPGDRPPPAPARSAAGSSARRRRRRAAVTAAAFPGRVTARRCAPSGAASSPS